jgi:membrane protein implicated in regulation of membrane protease activity
MCENRLKDPKAIKWLPLGLVLLSISLLLPDFYHPVSQLSKDWADGVRGLLAGIGIGIELMILIRLGRQRRLGRS